MPGATREVAPDQFTITEFFLPRSRSVQRSLTVRQVPPSASRACSMHRSRSCSVCSRCSVISTWAGRCPERERLSFSACSLALAWRLAELARLGEFGGNGAQTPGQRLPGPETAEAVVVLSGGHHEVLPSDLPSAPAPQVLRRALACAHRHQRAAALRCAESGPPGRAAPCSPPLGQRWLRWRARQLRVVAPPRPCDGALAYMRRHGDGVRRVRAGGLRGPRRRACGHPGSGAALLGAGFNLLPRLTVMHGNLCIGFGRGQLFSPAGDFLGRCRACEDAGANPHSIDPRCQSFLASPLFLSSSQTRAS